MKEVDFDLGHTSFSIKVPVHTDILAMGKALPLSNPEAKICQALRNPTGCSPLESLVRKKLESKPEAKAVVVISDNTRPVPYSGESGILLPIVEEMIKAGLEPSRIRILVATGTHRAMTDDELREIIDPRVFSLNLRIINHDSRNFSELKAVGRTELGGEILLNRHYLESDLKILTGLVESHFMAGTSGGRKSICPGVLAEESTYVLHSGPVLASPRATNLILEGNPVHEEALRVAKMAGCDMNVNVTLDSDYRLTGIFAGDLEKAHLAAVEKLRSYVAIPAQKKYDLVLTHTGYVGVNHYQAAKAAVVAAPLIKSQGICLLAAHHTDPDPIGGSNYKKMMRRLGELGTDKFIDMILDPSWTFVPEQWEAQMWTRLFRRIPPENLIYCSLEIPREAFSWLPETDARSLVKGAKKLPGLVESSLGIALKKLRSSLPREPRVAFLPDGPYGIPVLEGNQV
ncbi:MAG: nickel-dependent lactate racemase [Candidatus Aminicenantes bacterium]|nr:nickel-dependent lactate racemase [Candidatus Aminicenantes bacterium]